MRALLVGPDDDARRTLHVMLDRRGVEVAAIDAESAKAWLEANQCDVVIAPAELAPALQDSAPTIAIIRPRDVAAAMSLLEAGIDHVVGEPIDELALALALRHVGAIPRRERATVSAIVGDGAAMRQLRTTIKQVAVTRTTVLVLGESGTGKELVARAIHEASPRAAKRFVAVNCAAIPGPLLESELFGHVRGAFTDAVRDKTGLFEDADGGTLFLDEVGELPIALQAKLLRALQESEIRRVGDTESIKVDVRLIAATLRDLTGEIAAGRFREDLYYRLAVLPVRIPPLRDRGEDIPQLAQFFAARHAARYGRAIELLPDALDALGVRAWPGNVRELENVIERAIVLADGDKLDAAAVGGGDGRAPRTSRDASDLSINRATRALEEDLIRRALAATQGNRTNAAKLLEISARTLLYKLKEYGIS